MVRHPRDAAATYEGGLDRGNIVLAARFIDAQNPLVLDGIVQQTNGFEDAYLNEGGRMAVYEVEDPAAARARSSRRVSCSTTTGGSATTTTSSRAPAADDSTTVPS